MEIEAKFAIADEPTFERLLTATALAGLAVQSTRIKHVHDRYLDTAGRSFLRGGFACRLRVSGDQHIVTLKALTPAEGAVHSRAELEVAITPGVGRQIADWPAAAATSLARQLSQDQPLELLFEVWQERHIRILRNPDDRRDVIELSLDRVRLGGREAPVFHELEAELLPAGRLDELQAVATELQAHWPLLPEPRSKFERGLALVHPELVKILRATASSDVRSEASP